MQVPRGYLVSTQFEMIVSKDTTTIDRLFGTLEAASDYAAGVKIPDLVSRALEEGLDLFDVGAVSIVAHEFIDSQLADVHSLRDFDYAELTKGRFQRPPADVLDA